LGRLATSDSTLFLGGCQGDSVLGLSLR